MLASTVLETVRRCLLAACFLPLLPPCLYFKDQDDMKVVNISKVSYVWNQMDTPLAGRINKTLFISFRYLCARL
jgi:hypothetical protein